ncbi:NERD domain-containing protein [Geodermatophilus sp. CPCC 205761]|uniref:NERD domain-containing protein n=1 Tax=Geodermatophilus sp. CPCC 205761 TaxID=2936597 RepID=UPI003EEFB185
MARFVPPLRVSSGRSPAETRVLRWLSRLSDEWTVLHSLGVLNHPFKSWAEADALVVGPPGVVVLEVKGGRVARRQGVWEFTDRSERVTRKRESPFDQAGGAHGAIRRHLVDHGALRRDQCSGWAVALPDVTLAGRAPDAVEQVLLDASSEWSAPDLVLTQWCRYWARRSRAASPLTPGDVAAVVDVLRGDLDLRPSLSLLADEVDEELTRVTLEQERVLRAAADNPRLAVAGRAGTGKTMLALAEARRLADEGGRVLLTCSSAPLARRLALAVQDAPRIDVRTPSQLPTATGADRYEAVVVDEAQDLGGGWRDIVDRQARGGVDAGTWRLFLDPAQDLIGVGVDMASTLPLSTTRMGLTLNCRNTRQIAVMASMLTRTELDAEAPVLGPEVVMHWWTDRSEQERLLAAELQDLVGSLPPARVAVLTQLPITTARRAELSRLAGVPLTGLEERRTDAVVVATAEEFKGLEAVAVLVADLESLDQATDRRHTYVACTRARVRLTLLLNEAVREEYQAGAAWFGGVVTRRATRREFQPF